MLSISKTTLMKHLLKLLPILLLVVNTPFGHAQAASENHVFMIHIGAFVKAKLADFNSVKSLGYIYADKEGNLLRVYMGDYPTEPAAYKILEKIKTNGYPDAFVTRRKLVEGQQVSMIQLGAEDIGAEIDWNHYNLAGRLYTVSEGNSIKIMTGMFENSAAANVQLPRIKQMGFEDAFVKRLNKAHLHRVTSFETNITLSDKMADILKSVEDGIPKEYAEKKCSAKSS